MSSSIQDAWIVNGSAETIGVKNVGVQHLYQYYGPKQDPIGDWLEAWTVNLGPHKKPQEDKFEKRLSDELWKDLESRETFSKARQTAVFAGAPGVGKTTTMQELMNRLTRRRREKNEIALGYIFFSDQQKLDTDAGAILMHLLRTLCVGTKYGHEMLEKLHLLTEETESLWASGERKPSLKEIRNTLIETVKRADEACIFIDALDECTNPEQLEHVLSTIREIQIESGVGVVMTVRPGENAALERCFEPTENCVWKEVRAHDEDIKAYVEGCFRGHGKVDRLDENGLEEAVNVIQRVSGGIFLLTVLNVEFVRPKLYAKDRRALPRCLEYLEESTRMSKLREIGFNERARNDDGRRVYDIKVLDNAYRINLERITNGSACESDTDLAEKVFSVLLTATRLLTIEELQHAVCAIQDLKEPPDFKLLHEWEALQGSCGGLIQQDQAGFVTFMHSSLQVFLDGHYEFFGDRERWMSRACSRYLASKSFSDGICKTVEALQTRLKDWPFLLYAAHYWRQHFGHKDVHPGVTPTNSQTCDDRCESATELFLCNGNVAAAAQIRSTPDDLQRRRLSQYLAQSDEQKGPRRLKCSLVIQEGSHPLVKRSNLEPNDTAGLHWACELGCTLLFRKVTIQDHKLDRTDWLLYTPLHYAAMTGCAEIVRDLINMGAQPDIGNVWKMTPLALAARNGHVCVVQSLLQLKGKVNVNSSDHNLNSNWSETVLPLDETIDSSNVVWTKLVGGRTPLHHAARDNRVEVVELLLADERTNVNHVDGDGFTALHRAAKKGNVEVVKLLVEHNDVDPTREILETSNGPNEHTGDTFLHLASRYPRDLSVVRFASQRFPDLVNTPNREGRTPLHCAASLAADDNVEVLLGTSGVIPDSRDHSMSTPLHLAVLDSAYHPILMAKKTIRHLQEKTDGRLQTSATSLVNINAQDVRMRTPLHHAVRSNKLWALESLLASPSARFINPDVEDLDGLTPLSTAIEIRNPGAFRVIHSHWGADHWALQSPASFWWKHRRILDRTVAIGSGFKVRLGGQVLTVDGAVIAASPVGAHTPKPVPLISVVLQYLLASLWRLLFAFLRRFS